MFHDPTLSEGRLLIINGDDFGLTESISRGIIESHINGVLTSTSVMANGPAFDTTIKWLDDCPALGMGIHLALVGEDRLLLSHSEIPSLTDKEGNPYKSWRSFLAAAATKRIDEEDIRRELTAQLQRVMQSCASTGRSITHIDTHQHLHLLPVVGGVVMDLGEKWNILSMRLPRISLDVSSQHKTAAPFFNILARRTAAEARRRGFAIPAVYAGLAEAGHLASIGFESVITSLRETAAPTAELGCHPGANGYGAGGGDRERYAWEFEWEMEKDALCSQSVRETIKREGFQLATFADLPNSRASRASLAVTRAVSMFDESDKSTRTHVRVRASTCPLEATVMRVPQGARTLDVGSGHGLLALALATDDLTRVVVGVDVDSHKIDLARKVAGNTKVTFLAGDGSVPEGPWDAITIVDVLYLLGEQPARVLIEQCARELAIGGTLLVHNSHISPRWKWYIAIIQEFISVRLARITKGDKVRFLNQDDIESWMIGAGLETTSVRADWGYVHPHKLTVGVRSN